MPFFNFSFNTYYCFLHHFKAYGRPLKTQDFLNYRNILSSCRDIRKRKKEKFLNKIFEKVLKVKHCEIGSFKDSLILWFFCIKKCRIFVTKQ